jgi:cytidylate kinase
MYRAVALLALQTGTDPGDASALARLAAAADIRFEQHPSGCRLFLNGRDVTDTVRSPEVTHASSIVSTHAEVRKHLVERQRVLGRDGGVVMEGRDIGTKVFPNAELKIFLDASPEVRGRRRLQDQESAAHADEAAVLREIAERDRRDRTREVSPLVPAPDAVVIDSTNLSAEQVVAQVLALAERKMQRNPSPRQ